MPNPKLEPSENKGAVKVRGHEDQRGQQAAAGEESKHFATTVTRAKPRFIGKT